MFGPCVGMTTHDNTIKVAILSFSTFDNSTIFEIVTVCILNILFSFLVIRIEKELQTRNKIVTRDGVVRVLDAGLTLSLPLFFFFFFLSNTFI